MKRHCLTLKPFCHEKFNAHHHFIRKRNDTFSLPSQTHTHIDNYKHIFSQFVRCSSCFPLESIENDKLAAAMKSDAKVCGLEKFTHCYIGNTSILHLLCLVQHWPRSNYCIKSIHDVMWWNAGVSFLILLAVDGFLFRFIVVILWWASCCSTSSMLSFGKDSDMTTRIQLKVALPCIRHVCSFVQFADAMLLIILFRLIRCRTNFRLVYNSKKTNRKYDTQSIECWCASQLNDNAPQNIDTNLANVRIIRKISLIITTFSCLFLSFFFTEYSLEIEKPAQIQIPHESKLWHDRQMIESSFFISFERAHISVSLLNSMDFIRRIQQRSNIRCSLILQNLLIINAWKYEYNDSNIIIVWIIEI